MLARKDLRFIEFSPFAFTTRVSKSVNSCKPKSEIDRDKTITDLPNRLRVDEEEIQSIKDWLGGAFG